MCEGDVEQLALPSECQIPQEAEGEQSLGTGCPAAAFALTPGTALIPRAKREISARRAGRGARCAFCIFSPQPCNVFSSLCSELRGRAL